MMFSGRKLRQRDMAANFRRSSGHEFGALALNVTSIVFSVFAASSVISSNPSSQTAHTSPRGGFALVTSSLSFHGYHRELWCSPLPAVKAPPNDRSGTSSPPTGRSVPQRSTGIVGYKLGALRPHVSLYTRRHLPSKHRETAALDAPCSSSWLSTSTACRGSVHPSCSTRTSRSPVACASRPSTSSSRPCPRPLQPR